MNLSPLISCLAVAATLLFSPACSETDKQTDAEKQDLSHDVTQPPPDSAIVATANIQPTQQNIAISPGLFDTTDRWRELFGLDGRLQIEVGRRDEQPSYACGPIELSFNATPTQPGVYTFVFVLIHHDGVPSQVHAVHLYVVDDPQNEDLLTITPGQYHSVWQSTVATGQQVKVYWVGGGGMSPPGVPVGWRLSEVVYTNPSPPFHTPGIPRYEYIGGE